MAWDVIIVGARCAGSPLARFLARAGKRVVLVDSATFPSDQPVSTHFIQPFGMRVLDELGLGDRVREIAPPVMTAVQILAGHAARFEWSGGCCPRRIDLDQMLLEGAREAGAEVRLGERVIELITDRGRVVGVTTRDRESRQHELRAELVVGADGRHSTIAELVGAEKYFAYQGARAAYWAYWPRPSWYDDPPYGGSTFIEFYDRSFRLCFPTNRDQLCIGVGFPREQAQEWKSDPRGKLEATLRTTPFFAKLVEAEPVTKPVGVVKLEYFFRRAAGPGWALVGDAGLHKDPTAGFGITDSLRDARALANAILSGGGDVAIERYWRQRDVESFALFNLARDMGELDYNNPLNALLYARMAANPQLAARMVGVVDREVSPLEVVRPSEIIRWTLGALLRGKLGVLLPFLRTAARSSSLQRELKRRRRLVVPALPA